MFKKAVDRIRTSNFSKGFEPMSMRVAEYASSWNIQLVEEGGALTVTELRRRFGCIFPGSVVQALVDDDARVGCKDDEIFELRTAKNDEDMHLHISAYLSGFLSVFSMRHLSVQRHRILHAPRPVHHTRLCFLVCRILLQELFLYL
jgi:hypothetical protein